MQKPLLRALIMVWNASMFSFISMSFAIASTDAHIMKTCSSIWLWRALTALSADLRVCWVKVIVILKYRANHLDKFRLIIITTRYHFIIYYTTCLVIFQQKTANNIKKIVLKQQYGMWFAYFHDFATPKAGISLSLLDKFHIFYFFDHNDQTMTKT